MVLRGVLAIIALLGVVATTSAQTTGTPSISGQVRDTNGAALPGVEIVVTGAEEERHVVADQYGSFVIAGSFNGSPATYSLRASLPGFKPFLTTVRAGLPVNIVMHIGCIAPDLYVSTGLDTEVKKADAVLRFRIDSASRPTTVELGRYCGTAIQYTATVIQAIKDFQRPNPTKLSFVEFGSQRRTMGAEYLALFERVDHEDRLHLGSAGYTALVVGDEVRCESTYLPCGQMADVIGKLRVIAAR